MQRGTSMTVPDADAGDVTEMLSTHRRVGCRRRSILGGRICARLYCLDSAFKMEWTPWGSNTTFLPSQRALSVNSVHSSLMSASLYFGFEVILRQALRTSTFWSLSVVFGKLVDPLHVMIEPSTSSDPFRTVSFGAKSEGPDDSIL